MDEFYDMCQPTRFGIHAYKIFRIKKSEKFYERLKKMIFLWNYHTIHINCNILDNIYENAGNADIQ